MALAHSDRLFTPIERQVIFLAATSERECEGLSGRTWSKSWFAGILRKILPSAAAKPLANERLEALRRFACACFSSGGRPDEEAVRVALGAGIRTEQVDNLAGLARRDATQR